MDVPTLVEFINGLHLPSVAIVSAKALVAYPFFYHLCNGIRHLVSFYLHIHTNNLHLKILFNNLFVFKYSMCLGVGRW